MTTSLPDPGTVDPDDLPSTGSGDTAEALVDEVVAGLFAIGLDINLALPYLSGAVAQRLAGARHDTERLIRLLRDEGLPGSSGPSLVPVDDEVGLDDPRVLTSLARHEVRVAEREGTPLDLLYLELGAPDVADEQGEETTARELATVLRRACRTTDVVARWSPSSFVVLMRGRTTEQACEVAHRLREAFGVRLAEGTPQVLSIGVVRRRAGESLEAIVARAEAEVAATRG